MPGRIIITFSLVLGLSACSMGWNPMNWFQSSKESTIALIPQGGFADTTDRRTIVSQVTDMQVLRTPGGAIIQVTGLPPRQGYWNAELVAENGERPVDGVLTYVFRIQEPEVTTGQGAPYTRQVFVAHAVSNVTLAGVRQIRVLGTENSRTARR